MSTTKRYNFNNPTNLNHTYGSLENNKLGEATLKSTHEQISFIRKIIPEGDIGVEIGRGDNINREVMIGREGIKEILNADSVEDLSLVHIDNVSGQDYSCYLCGKTHGEVHRMKQNDSTTFAISFHFDCLTELAETGKQSLEEYKEDILATQI